MNVYTVFREDYDEHNEGHEGMWNICFPSLEAAKKACEEGVALLWYGMSDLPLPDRWDWAEHAFRNDCWILDDDETGTVHTVMKTKIAERS